MRKYVIMGIQGSGKGTHAKMLAGDFDLEHIAVGDIFRWNVQHHTKLGAQVRRTMAAGLLVGDDLVDAVVQQRLSEHDWNYGFIIDGFPACVPGGRPADRSPAGTTPPSGPCLCRRPSSPGLPAPTRRPGCPPGKQPPRGAQVTGHGGATPRAGQARIRTATDSAARRAQTQDPA